MMNRRKKNEWPPDHTTLMVDCIIDGMTMSEAALKINMRYRTTYTKNSVIGKWNRFCAKENMVDGKL